PDELPDHCEAPQRGVLIQAPGRHPRREVPGATPRACREVEPPTCTAWAISLTPLRLQIWPKPLLLACTAVDVEPDALAREKIADRRRIRRDAPAGGPK